MQRIRLRISRYRRADERRDLADWIMTLPDGNDWPVGKLYNTTPQGAAQSAADIIAHFFDYSTSHASS